MVCDNVVIITHNTVWLICIDSGGSKKDAKIAAMRNIHIGKF